MKGRSNLHPDEWVLSLSCGTVTNSKGEWVCWVGYTPGLLMLRDTHNAKALIIAQANRMLGLLERVVAFRDEARIAFVDITQIDKVYKKHQELLDEINETIKKAKGEVE